MQRLMEHIIFLLLVFALGLSSIKGKAITIEPLHPVLGYILIAGLLFIVTTDIIGTVKSRKNKNKD